MIAGIQILGILFGIFMIYLSFLYFRRKEFQTGDFVMWLFIWLGFLFAIIFSDTLKFLLKPLAIYRVMDLLIISSLVVMFGLMFIIYKTTRRNENNIKEIVRKLALSGRKWEKKKQ